MNIDSCICLWVDELEMNDFTGLNKDQRNWLNWTENQ